MTGQELSSIILIFHVLFARLSFLAFYSKKHGWPTDFFIKVRRRFLRKGIVKSVGNVWSSYGVEEQEVNGIDVTLSPSFGPNGEDDVVRTDT